MTDFDINNRYEKFGGCKYLEGRLRDDPSLYRKLEDLDSWVSEYADYNSWSYLPIPMSQLETTGWDKFKYKDEFGGEFDHSRPWFYVLEGDGDRPKTISLPDCRYQDYVTVSILPEKFASFIDTADDSYRISAIEMVIENDPNAYPKGEYDVEITVVLNSSIEACSKDDAKSKAGDLMKEVEKQLEKLHMCMPYPEMTVFEVKE